MKSTKIDIETENTKGIIGWFANNKVAANILMILLVVGGIATTFSIKQEVFPDFESDRISIRIAYPGTSPKEVEEGIVLLVEEAIRDIEGVKKFDSTASEGSASVTVELESDANKIKVLSDVKNAVDGISNMPDEAETANINLATHSRAVIDVVLYGNMDDFTLRNLAEKARDDMLQRENITSVEFSGVKPREIAIDIKQDKLREYGLKLTDVSNKIRIAARDYSSGSLKTESGEILIRVQERKTTGSEFSNIPIMTSQDGTSVLLGEIAEITDGFTETDGGAYFNGMPSVFIEVSREGDQKPIEVSEAVKEYVEILKTQLPEGVSADTYNDSAEIYKDRLDLLLRNAYLGLALVIILLGIFLDIKLALWVTLGIPISFLGTIFLMPFFDLSINMMTLFAFIVALGMIVDDAIVVGENIYTNRKKGMSFIKAAIVGTKQVAVPVTFAIITNIVAFLPMVFFEGMMGRFMRVVPIVVCVAFTISLVEAFFILPAHLAHSKDSSKRSFFYHFHRLQKRLSDKIESAILNIFKPILKFAVKNRYATFAAALALLIIVMSYVTSGKIAMTFSPGTESDDVEANIELPYGSPMTETIKVQDKIVTAAKKIIEKLGGDKVCKGIYTRLGSSTGFRWSTATSSSHKAYVRIYFTKSDERGFDINDFVKLWRANVGEIAGLDKLAFSVREMGPSGGSAIYVDLTHDDSTTLEEAAAELAEMLKKYPEVKDIDDGLEIGKPQLDYKLSQKGYAAGLTPAILGSQMRANFYGSEALRLQRGRDEIKIVVRLPESERESEKTLENLLLKTPSGSEIPLNQAVDVTRGFAFQEIKRIDGRRVIAVTADVAPREKAREILLKVQETDLENLKSKYSGLTYTIGGRERERTESMMSIFDGFIIAFIVIFAMLAIVFKSYIQPLIIMIAIPFGIIGAVIGHLIMGFNLSLISFMGIVALSGVVINDALVLVDFANKLRNKGHSSFDAIVTSGVSRFRPVILTTMTTFLGLTPMIFETSVQAKMLVPMAISLGFGELFSTIIILILVPSVFIIVEDIKKLFKNPFKAEDAENTNNSVVKPVT